MCNIFQVYVTYILSICHIFFKYMSHIFQVYVTYFSSICHIYFGIVLFRKGTFLCVKKKKLKIKAKVIQ